MGTPLRILIIEDSANDAEILLWELKRGGFDCQWQRVETADEMVAALNGHQWDILVSDYVMPRFSGLAALQLLQDRELDLPFIMVSGKIGEDTAVEAMRAGAHDYLLKDNLTRLVPTIKRELAECRLREQQRRAERELHLLKQAIETIPLGVTISDLEGRIAYTNPAEAQMHGYEIEELIGQDCRVLAPREIWCQQELTLDRYVTSHRESVNLHRNGTPFPVHLISTLVADDNGLPLGIVSVCEDITVRKQVEAVLHKQQAAMESSMDGMVITDDTGSILYVNQAQADSYGCEPAELVGKSWSVFYDVAEAARISGEIVPLLAKEGKWRGESRGWRQSGESFPLEVSLTVIEGGGVIWVFRDITERKQAEEKLRFMSTHDALTGLYNRAYFELELDRLDRSRLFPVSAIMVDVDGLKVVNDRLGHGAGDRLLKQAANVLLTIFRAEDMVARIGGDEFIVLLPETDEEAVAKALERIEDELCRLGRRQEEPAVSLSLGAATTREPGTLLDTIKTADERMYQVKLSRDCRDRQ